MFIRRLAKAAWWTLTPWRMPARLAHLKARARSLEAKRAAQAILASASAERAGRRSALFFDARAAVSSQLGLDINGPSIGETGPLGRHEAARLCIQLLLGPTQLYRRFPDALSAGPHGRFATWLACDASAELGLSDAATTSIVALFAESYGEKARSLFVSNPDARSALPHGLLAGGHPLLFRWLLDYACHLDLIASEEACWLLLEAAEDPLRELMLAFLFTPQWQKEHPEGLGVFGRRAFADWLCARFGLSGAWLSTEAWPDWWDPADQIRMAYRLRPAWRAAHPAAMIDPRQSASLLEWLATDEASIPAEALDWLRLQDSAALADEIARPGINIIGHFCYPSGLRVSVRSLAAALGEAGLRSSLRDIRTDAADDPGHFEFRGMETFDLSLIHTQPQPFFKDAYARADLMPRRERSYRVAYWYWEFETIPDSWVDCAKEVDEVWTATEFVANGLREKLDIPVRTLFPGVALAPYERRHKSDFNIPESHFCFLFTFHMMSVMERKNPLGLIRAFRSAFGPQEQATLVLKTSFGARHPELLQAMQDAAKGANILIIDEIYSPDEVLSLMDACDAYISLHRSEGLGLTMAEAMLMAKPVIATAYSGNMDFMTADNSLLVDYTLVKLERAIPPYDEGLSWAEPSVEHAARLMRKVFDDPEWAKALGARARRSALERLSLEAAGRKLAASVSEIASAFNHHDRRHGPSAPPPPRSGQS